MHVIDLSARIKEFGTNVEHAETYGQAIANYVLARAVRGPAAKFMVWAFSLHNNQPLELDDPDYRLFRETVETNEVIFTYIKAHVLQVIDAAK